VAARRALAPAGAVLPPALCYHVYAALAERTRIDPTHVTLRGTCWRHEGERTAPLERGWSFTMREAVWVGAASQVDPFLGRGAERSLALAAALGLEAEIVPATDPFFAPTARGRALLQRVKGLKRELLLPLGGGRTIAAASFNHHGTFFGDAFGIRTGDGAPAVSGCVAFGIERWLLAFLVAHGPEPRGWPTVRADLAEVS
jgi:seryl-tRNA synthetase